MVLTIPPVRKKFTLAISDGRAILHSMMNQENQPTREDLLALIIEHNEQRGIRDQQAWSEQLEAMECFSYEALWCTLEELEETAP
jgi:hypothetical protein